MTGSDLPDLREVFFPFVVLPRHDRMRQAQSTDFSKKESHAND